MALSPSFAVIANRGKIQSKKVVIVGAGLAGLACAYELNEAGYQIDVLEALDKPGGRVRTFRDGFEDGQYAEAGGQGFFPVEPNYAKQYIEKFNLKLTPSGVRGMSNIYYFNGEKIILSKQKLVLKFPLTNSEINLGIDGMREKYVKPITDQLWAQLKGNELSEADKFYDNLSMAEALMRNGASPEAIRLLNLLNIDFVGESPEVYSSADMIGSNFNALTQIQTLKGEFISIHGGNDLLPKAFADRLKGKIKFNAIVKEIYQNNSSVNVTYTEGSKQSNLECDFLVLAIPPRPIRNIKINTFSKEKLQAINSLPMVSVSRIYYQTNSRLWSDQGLSGNATTDLPITSFWESTLGQTGDKGIIQGYIMGKHSRHFQGLQDDEKIEYTLRQFEILFPGIRDKVIKHKFISWDENPFSQGAYCYFRPGDMQNIFPQLRRAEGRIIFAGSHTASRLLHNSMQGALESGKRAASEIMKS